MTSDPKSVNTLWEPTNVNECVQVAWLCCFICGRRSILGENHIFDPCDPHVTFDLTYVRCHVSRLPMMLVTKFGQNR